MRHAAANVVAVPAAAVVDGELRRGARMLHEPVQQADRCVLLFDETMAEEVREGERTERSDRVDEQRVRAVEGVDEAAAVGQARPPARLHRPADPERQRVEAFLPLARFEALLVREPPQVAGPADELRVRHPEPAGRHARFVRNLNKLVRVGYELCTFVIVWVLAYEAMVLKRTLVIRYEAATTGVSTAQIIDRQNASGGMWAFAEGMEVMYLVVLIYLLWPIVFNMAGRVGASMASPKAR